MAPAGGHVAQGHKHESAFLEPGVGQDQPVGRAAFLILERQGAVLARLGVAEGPEIPPSFSLEAHIERAAARRAEKRG